MNYETLKKTFDNFIKIQEEILFRKGNDYSSDSDRLSNFKAAGEIIQLSPELQCLSLVATKVARLGNLLKNQKTVLNESVEDSLLDLANYTFLIYCIIKENTTEKATTTVGSYGIMNKDTLIKS